MNTAPPVTERADGYVQDLASQWVAEAVGAAAGGAGRRPVRRTRRQGHRAGRHGRDGGRRRHPPGPGRPDPRQRPRPARCWPPTPPDPPFAPASLDRVLIDAPCSGLGTLRRRPDARWRIDAASPERLAAVQRHARRRRRPAAAPRRHARLLRLHPDRRRDDGRRRPPGRRLPGPRARRPRWRRRGRPIGRGARLLPAGRRHRRHVPPPPPRPLSRARARQRGARRRCPPRAFPAASTAICGRRTGSGLRPQVAAVVGVTSQPVVARSGSGSCGHRLRGYGQTGGHGAAGEGDHGVGRGGRRHPGGPLRRRPRGPPRAGRLRRRRAHRDGRRHRRGGSHAPSGLRRVRRARRHDRRHGVRAARPHPGGHARRASSARRPGSAEAMRLVSPLGRLCRAAAGTVGEASCSTRPGSTKGCVETLDAVLDVVPHALELLAGDRPH